MVWLIAEICRGIWARACWHGGTPIPDRRKTAEDGDSSGTTTTDPAGSPDLSVQGQNLCCVSICWPSTDYIFCNAYLYSTLCVGEVIFLAQLNSYCPQNNFLVFTCFLIQVIYWTCVICSRGTTVAQWLRCCATNQKVAGLIPAGVSGFFIDINSFLSHYGPGVDSAFNRNEYQEYFLGAKAAGA